MDDLQDRLVQLGLVKLEEFGFALAGGYALQDYGLTHRLSEDVDLFTEPLSGTYLLAARYDDGGYSGMVNVDLTAAARDVDMPDAFR